MFFLIKYNFSKLIFGYNKLKGSLGVKIGSHSYTHPHLSNCNDGELQYELLDSKHYLEDLIGQTITSIAYLYGSTNHRVKDAAKRAGYKVGVWGGKPRFTINRPERDNLMLNRCVVLNNDTARVLRKKLHGNWDWFRWCNLDSLPN